MAAPVLNEELMKALLDGTYETQSMDVRHDDLSRWLMYNGNIKNIVFEAIKKEFKKPETVNELKERIIPLNIPQKIVNKLAHVYNEDPERKSADENESDQDLMDNLVQLMEFNTRQKEANRYYKLFKCNLQEMIVDDKGYPGLRNIPRHAYSVWSHSHVTPNIPDTFAKFVNFDKDRDKSRVIWWTDTQHIVTNGYGKIQEAEMAAMNNPDGINPYGVTPFIYINQDTYSSNPVPDDDLLRMGIVIPLLLSDLSYAIKYLSYAVVYTVGAGETDIPFSPNSIINFGYGPDGQKPEIGTVAPTVNIDGVLKLIESLVAMLLSTKNLSTSAISGTLSAANPASGVARALDSAESQEDKKDQQAVFWAAEKELWWKFAYKLYPVWRKARMLAAEVNREFSSTFDIKLKFREPQIVISERETIELSVYKIQNGLSTTKRELERIYPGLKDKDYDQMLLEIMEERAKQNEYTLAAAPPVAEEVAHRHSHMGTEADDGVGGLHDHEMLDGSGKTSTESYGEKHVHVLPDGSQSSLEAKV